MMCAPTAKFRYNDGERQEAINVNDYACFCVKKKR